MVAIVSIGLSIEVCHKTNLITLKWCHMSRYLHLQVWLKQSYVSNKIERFSYKGGRGIEAFKRSAGLGY